MSLFGFESNYIDVDGIKTHYIEAGSGSQALILIHGGGAGADGPSNFSHIMNRYGKHMRTIAVDMVGFGHTDKPSPDVFAYTQQARTNHIARFIEVMGFDKVNLIGNSMGGTTSFGVALRRPDLVNKLVLMGSAIKCSAEDLAARRGDVAPVVNFDQTPEGMRRIIDCLTYSYEPDEAYIDYRIKGSLSEESRAANAATMKWVRENGLFYTDEQLAQVKCPVLVVGGKHDVMVPIVQIHEIIDKIPQAYGYILPYAGHWIMIEEPDRFVNCTLDFFGFI